MFHPIKSLLSLSLLLRFCISSIITMTFVCTAPAQDALADSTSFTLDGYVLGPNENVEEKISRNLLLKTVVSKRKCYEGETIEAEYLLYTRLSIDARVGRKSGFSGFSSIELQPTIPPGQFEYRKHNGKVYKVYSIRRVQLTALQPGQLSLAVVAVEAIVTFFKKQASGSDDAAENFLPGNRVSREVQVTNEAVTVEAIPLPETGKPQSMIPAVGHFEIAAKLANNRVEAGKIDYLLVSVSGNGQWSQVQCPQVQWPKGITTYEATANDQLDSQHIPVAGIRTYKLPFEPAGKMNGVIPPLSLTYFNPENGRYETVFSEPVNLVVTSAVDSDKQDDSVNAKHSSTESTAIFSKWAPYFFFGIALLLVGIVAFGMMKKEQKEANRLDENDGGWDTPETSVGNVAKKLDAAKGVFVKQNEMEPLSTATEIQQLAIQYKQVLNDQLALQLRDIGHPGDPLYLRLVQWQAPEYLSRRIMGFMEQCDQISTGNYPGYIAGDAEKFSSDFYDLLRQLRQTGNG